MVRRQLQDFCDNFTNGSCYQCQDSYFEIINNDTTMTCYQSCPDGYYPIDEKTCQSNFIYALICLRIYHNFFIILFFLEFSEVKKCYLS